MPTSRCRPSERLQLIPAGQEHIIEQEDGKRRWVKAVSELSKAFALCSASDEATAIRQLVSKAITTDDEIAFYDALAANESAVQAMGDEKLKLIAAELITQVRKSVTIDWTLREGARAKIRVMVKRILNKYGYPPDLQEEAVRTVLAQAELLCADWVPSSGVGSNADPVGQ